MVVVSNPPVKALAETNALYAVMRGDMENAQRIVGDLLNEELSTFFQQVLALHEVIVTEIAGRAPTRSTRNGH